jgi:hypothetical protein
VSVPRGASCGRTRSSWIAADLRRRRGASARATGVSPGRSGLRRKPSAPHHDTGRATITSDGPAASGLRTSPFGQQSLVRNSPHGIIRLRGRFGNRQQRQQTGQSSCMSYHELRPFDLNPAHFVSRGVRAPGRPGAPGRRMEGYIDCSFIAATYQSASSWQLSNPKPLSR